MNIQLAKMRDVLKMDLSTIVQKVSFYRVMIINVTVIGFNAF